MTYCPGYEWFVIILEQYENEYNYLYHWLPNWDPQSLGRLEGFHEDNEGFQGTERGCLPLFDSLQSLATTGLYKIDFSNVSQTYKRQKICACFLKQIT